VHSVGYNKYIYHIARTYNENLDFSLKIGYIGSLKFSCYYLQYVPASKLFDHAWFEVLGSHNTVVYLNRQPIISRQVSFSRILDKFTRRGKPMRIFGEPGNKLPDKWRSRPASWSSGQSLWLLIMRSRVRFPALPWEMFLKGRIPAVTMVWVG
jgi:hypothetical protein